MPVPMLNALMRALTLGLGGAKLIPRQVDLLVENFLFFHHLPLPRIEPLNWSQYFQTFFIIIDAVAKIS
jgi:hypothetical protein